MANNHRKTIFVLLNLVLTLAFCLPVLAQSGYTLLEPSILLDQNVATTNMGLKDYLKNAYLVFLVVIITSAVIMFVWGGLIYITTDIAGKKGDAKSKIINALLGLLLAAISYLILYVIGGDTFLNYNLNLTAS